MTLIEMMAALTVVMIVLVSLVAALINSEKAQQISEGTDRATQIAQSRIERIRQMNWADIGFYTDTYGTPPAEYTTYAPAGETRVCLGSTDPNEGLNVIQPFYEDTSLKNRMKVYTYITWGRDSTLGRNATPTGCPNSTYSFKRVKVVVDWTPPGGTQRRLTVNETWFSPDAEDAVPPGVPIYVEP